MAANQNPTPQGWVILKRKKVGDFHPQIDSLEWLGRLALLLVPPFFTHRFL